jgi:hypothetical protein
MALVSVLLLLLLLTADYHCCTVLVGKGRRELEGVDHRKVHGDGDPTVKPHDEEVPWTLLGMGENGDLPLTSKARSFGDVGLSQRALWRV